MRLILRKEVDALGDVGDVVEVSDGYGMNHLIPQGLAIHATAHSVRAAKHEQLLRDAQIQAAKRGSEEEAQKYAGIECEFTVRAGEDGRLFGSVTNRDIEASLAEKGFEVSRRKIMLEEPIRRLGEHTVQIRLHPEVRVEIKVLVLADDSEPSEAEKTESHKGAPEDAEVVADEVLSDETSEAGDPEAGDAEPAGEEKPVEA